MVTTVVTGGALVGSMPTRPTHGVSRVQRVLHEVAGLPLLIQGADGGSAWVFCDDAHTLPRAFDWSRDRAGAQSVLARQLDMHGYLVLDSFLPLARVEQLRSHVFGLHAAGELIPGEQYGATPLGKRGDVVCMSSSDEPRCPALLSRAGMKASTCCPTRNRPSAAGSS